MWTAWRLDGPTWAWIGWLAAFVVIETWALSSHYRHTLTAHLRPIFLAFPVTWWLAVGLWLWLGVHLLAPTLEAWIAEVVAREVR